MVINPKVKEKLPILNLDNLYIVADFDRTITNGSSKTSWSIIASSDLAIESYISDRQALYEAYYEPGIEYMFTHGILYTDDMAFKKMVGLEDEDAVEPTKTIKLEDNFIKRMVSYMPASDFEKEMEKLSGLE